MRHALFLTALIGGTVVLTARLARIADQYALAEARAPAVVADAAPHADGPRPFVGVLVAAESVDLASKIDGQVKRIDVRLGQAVSSGSVLGVLSNPVLVQELRVAAELERTTAERLGREEGLFRSQTISTAAIAQTRHEARLASARADQARAALSEGAVRAPFDGVIAARYAAKGAYVKAGAPLLRLVASGPLRLRFAVGESEASTLPPGTRLVATLDPDSLQISARVEAVSSEIEPSSRMVFAEARIEEPEGLTRLVGRQVRVTRAESATR
jgi:membrane fusion protein (multidrug efflux system)